MDFEFPVGLIIFMLAFVVLIFASMWKIFEKAGEAGWQALIPIYNCYVLIKITGKPGWWLLLWLIPIVNYVFIIWTTTCCPRALEKKKVLL